MFLLPQRFSSLIGIDIQVNEIRFLQLTRIKEKFRLDNIHFVFFPSEVISAGKIQEIKMIKEAITAFVKKTKTTHFPVAMALPDSCVMNKTIPISKKWAEEEIFFEVIQQAEQHFGTQYEKQWYMDFFNVREMDDEQIEIRCVAARNDMVEDYRKVIQESNLELKIMDIFSHASQRATSYPVEDLLCTHPVNQTIFKKNLSRMQISYGLALRRIPAW